MIQVFRSRRRSRHRRCRGVTVLLASFALLSPLAFPASALGQLLNFRTYGHDSGLPQVQVMALVQDARGFLWLGSYGGVARFDGVAFKTLTANDGLSSNVITDLAVDSAGEVVAATAGGGVCFLAHGKIACIGEADGLAGNDVTSVLADRDGSVWVAANGGLSLVRDHRVVRTYGVGDGLPSQQVTRVVRDGQGRLWVSTSGGAARMVHGRFVTDRMGVPGSGALTVLASTSEGLVLTDPAGLYLASGGRVRRLMGALDRVSDVGRDVAESPDGTIWIATYGGVLRDRGGKVDRFTRENGLPTDRIDRVIVDREGDVWFGTESGLTELVPGPFEFFTAGSGLPDPFVSGFVQDRRGRIWVTTERGPAIWDGHGFRAVPLPGAAKGVPAFPIVNAPRGGVLIGTLGAGLAWVRPSGRATVYGRADGFPSAKSLRVESLVPDSGDVWIGTDGGLLRWSRGRITVPRDSTLATTRVASLALDARGRLWIGPITGGVLRWDGRRVVRLGKAQGLTDQTVWNMARAPDGAMWLGTNGDGAFRIAGDRITRLTTASGLSNDFVWQVQPDRSGDMWFFTNRGLDRLRHGKVRHYGPGNGLFDEEGTEAASMQDSSGELWFGVGTGAYRYDPALDVESERAPPIYIDGVHADGKPLPSSDVVLPPSSSGLEVSFASPTYRDRAAVRFRYRLGPERPWSAPQAEPGVSLAGLRPGTYTLQVVAENASGRRSDPPASLTFSVQPEFWETWWFRGLLLFLVAGAIASVPWARSRRLQREHEVLNSLVEERTHDLAEKTAGLEREIAGREAAEKERLRLEEQLHQSQKMEAIGRLAGGIAHDFNNLLTAVMGHAELLELDLGETHPSCGDVKEIHQAAARGADLVSQLLAYSRQQIIRHDLVDLNEKVEESARLLQRVIGDDVVLEVRKSANPCPVRFDRTQMDQVLVNLAVNAKDAMPSGGRLTFQVGCRDVEATMSELGPDEVVGGRYVTLEVRDTGTGMDPDVLAHAFDPFFTTKETGRGTGLGLATVYGAVHQSGGLVQVRSVPGEGTSFTLYFPPAEA